MRVNWENVNWICDLWDELPAPTLEDGIKALSLLLAELERDETSPRTLR
jgi:hypothetical protein